MQKSYNYSLFIAYFLYNSLEGVIIAKNTKCAAGFQS